MLTQKVSEYTSRNDYIRSLLPPVPNLDTMTLAQPSFPMFPAPPSHALPTTGATASLPSFTPTTNYSYSPAVSSFAPVAPHPGLQYATTLDALRLKPASEMSRAEYLSPCYNYPLVLIHAP